ncbi:SUMF1/EgtB/PvdO family nonheme iron enzyme [Roseiconus lacunae]|uniref:formylglycine-generating enzyme family protein n=1 Tax=Roseiconus lacunae TaxID=2605694 RepID=UPI003085370C|nr:SUMF1/EgtB/PvdO family nonheme iron enzyme [Stieleria sp. HD01]
MQLSPKNPLYTPVFFVSITPAPLGLVRRSRCLGLCVILLTSLSMHSAPANDGQNSGLLANQPHVGRAVETKQGFMVPYSQDIPGTEIEFEMIPVPGDPYRKIQPFWIGKFEVTLREYREYAAMYSVFKADRTRPDFTEPDRVDAVSAPTEVYNPQDRFAGAESLQCPAYSMTLFAAKQYTKWLSLLTDRPYRLPLESEWIKACKAGGTGYFWKDDQLRKLAFFNLETEGVQPVGSKAPNPLGIYDMQGNVSEWVITSFPTGRPGREERPPTKHSEVLPPVWIAKGGNFASRLEECLPAHRFTITEDEWDEEATFPNSVTWLGSYSDRTKIGFRVVRQLGELDKVEMSKFWDVANPSYDELIEFKLESGRGARGSVDKETFGKMKDASEKMQAWID